MSMCSVGFLSSLFVSLPIPLPIQRCYECDPHNSTHFRASKSGRMVNICSGAGVFTLPAISLYHARKFAPEGWTESMSYELGIPNIFVSSHVDVLI